MIRPTVKTFACSMLVLGLLSAYPARLIGGRTGLLDWAAAALIVFLPGVLAFAWTVQPGQSSPGLSPIRVLTGAGAGMGITLAAALLLAFLAPHFQRPGFWLWLGAFYLAALALKVIVLYLADARPHRQVG